MPRTATTLKEQFKYLFPYVEDGQTRRFVHELLNTIEQLENEIEDIKYRYVLQDDLDD